MNDLQSQYLSSSLSLSPVRGLSALLSKELYYGYRDFWSHGEAWNVRIKQESNYMSLHVCKHVNASIMINITFHEQVYYLFALSSDVIYVYEKCGEQNYLGSDFQL